ncbi:B12-binding domain-containing radical SAM protein [Telmatospirillum siberiense]|uniref:B12-binding domain-containing radical SAM protein n=1 Tax=Telmatospirillum siberiense TaxID=382514 RepID=A0A2N3PZZ4_9PROT|nr:radical SAM protein [Telmatospirillum siberiense]PKU25978.1 B12-binding domain-containing radical SAM protein [Telmatospirillum siberiense]
MKRVLFLIPMHVEFESFVNPIFNMRTFAKSDGKIFSTLATDLPIGPLSMSAYIKKFEDVDVKLIDFNVEAMLAPTFNYDRFYDFCYDVMKDLSFVPDIVGVSSLFGPSFFNFIDCAKVAKSLFKDALVIGGGNIPTNSYKYIYNDLKCAYFDALCFGEGEKPLLALLRAPDVRSYLEESNSWITMDKIRNSPAGFFPVHDFIENLDEIPFYDYGLVDITRHGLNPLTTGFKAVIDAGQKQSYHVMTSRGCPYFCTFCASHRVHGRKMRYHSLERVREDLVRLKNECGAQTIIFQDDHLMSDRERVYEILRMVKELEFSALFQNGLTLYALDRPMLEAFYDAGVRHLVLPVESGSEKVLKEQMHKPLKIKISKRVAEDCRDLGIYTNTNILIGMPGETKKDIDEAIENLKDIPVNWFNIACASPLAGSEMHEIALRKGYISGEVLGSDYHKALIETEDFTPEFIQEKRYLMNLELNFVFNNDMRCGRYDLAVKGFDNVLRFRSDHAFAYYFLTKCYQELGLENDHQEALEGYLKYKTNPSWQKYFEYFNLPDDPSQFDAVYQKSMNTGKGSAIERV